MNYTKTMKKRSSTRGFTIVELLIVIVVIAVLAAITIVAYNGIQSRAHDTAVKNDISNLVKKIRLYEAENGNIPAPGSTYGANQQTTLPGISVAISRSSYDTSVQNLFYCSGTIAGQPTFIITARSKSGNILTYKPSEGVTTTTGGSTQCATPTPAWDSGTYGWSYGYYNTTNLWFGWTNG